jgi:hypothetical protein
MKNNLVLIAILSTIATIGSTIIYHLNQQNKLAEEAAAQQLKERRMLQMDIEATRQDTQKTRNILLRRWQAKPQDPRPTSAPTPNK